MRLAGKRALVTGAASGIGHAVVTAFLLEGADVIAADLVYARAPISQASDRKRIVGLDVANEEEWRSLAATMGQLDVLVACAGICEAKPITETGLQDWQRIMAVNLEGAFLSVKHGALAMQSNSGGSIVLIGSASGTKASPGASAYCVSKAGVQMLAKTAALELKPRNIRVNCVSPAAVVTPMWQSMSFWSEMVGKHGSEQGAWNALGGNDPSMPSIQRMAFPEEIAAAALFLSSDDSAHITGLDLLVDAGYTL